MASVLLSALVERCFVSRMQDFYGHISSKMADFCSKMISTVTGQVSLMPQTAVARALFKMKYGPYQEFSVVKITARADRGTRSFVLFH